MRLFSATLLVDVTLPTSRACTSACSRAAPCPLCISGWAHSSASQSFLTCRTGRQSCLQAHGIRDCIQLAHQLQLQFFLLCMADWLQSSISLSFLTQERRTAQ